MTLIQLALLGAVIGLPLGYVFQRTKLCFNSAYREAIVHKKLVLIRLIALAVLVQMIGLALIIQFNIGGVTTSVVPFDWLATIVGGFFFGISMVYAEGCSSTVWYRVGNGNMGALVTLIGFAIGEWVLRFGPLGGFLEAIQTPEITLSSGVQATLPNALRLNTWIVVLPLALLLGWWLARGKSGAYLGGWNWRKGGLLLGVIGTLAWVVAWPTGWTYGVGVVGATGEYVEILFEGPGVLNWGSFMLLALPVGAFVAAWRKGELLLLIPNLPSTMRMFTAGLAMGMSATIAWGCNIGHGFTGVPALALSSLTATIFTFFGAWVGNYLRFIRPQRIRPSTIEVRGS
ncbi:MAG: YeeE/YedE family protein [Anaerolineales bacterium]|jgi:hypothetical protein